MDRLRAFVLGLVVAAAAAAGAEAPRLVHSVPATGAANVPLDVDVLRFHFDQDMEGGMSVMESATGEFPALAESPFRWANARTFEIRVGTLKPATTYAVQLNSARARNFRSVGGVPLAPAALVFRTAAAGPQEPVIVVPPPAEHDVIVVPPPPPDKQPPPGGVEPVITVQPPRADEPVIVVPPPGDDEPVVVVAPPPPSGVGTRYQVREERLGLAPTTMFYPTREGPRGCHYAFQDSEGGQQRYVVDGRAGPKFDGFEKDSFLFSGDGSRFAYVALRDGKACAVVNHRAGQAFEKVGFLDLSDDGLHVIYAGSNGDDHFAVVDGRPSGPCIGITGVAVSRDGRHVAYAAVKGTADRPEVVLVTDGRERPVPHVPVLLCFSPDGQRLAYAAAQVENGQATGKLLVVADGVAGPPCDDLDDLVFSADSRHVAYKASRGDRQFVVLDGRPHPDYDEVKDLEFGPVGGRLLYVAIETNAGRNRKFMLVVDGTPGPAHGHVPFSSFSPDGRRVAYAAETYGVEGEEFVIADGVRGPVFHDDVFAPRFSADSRHVVYTGKKDGKYHVMVDGKPRAETTDRLVGGELSSDGSHVAWSVQTLPGRKTSFVVLDGTPGPEFETLVAGPVFRADDVLEYIGCRDGVAFRVVHVPVR